MTESEAEDIANALRRTPAGAGTLIRKAEEAIRWLLQELEKAELDLEAGYFPDNDD